jgi:hypothetical protein
MMTLDECLEKAARELDAAFAERRVNQELQWFATGATFEQIAEWRVYQAELDVENLEAAMIEVRKWLVNEYGLTQ